MTIKRWLIGRPLKSNVLSNQKLSKTKALAILSSDALSSVAYGPEQVLIILMAVSITALWYSIPIMLAVLSLLFIIILSYRQLIYAYPQGGGAYVVSKQHIGTGASLIAGGSLLVDYVLTVAVSVSAGTDAITSAFPKLAAFNVWIAISFVVILVIINLRGITEAASILAYPVYLFVASIILLIIVGVYQIASGQVETTLHTPIGTAVSNLSLFIILKAFASGSSALTGVEAISNAIPNFKEPAPVNAAKTLTLMGCILAVLFAGIVYITYMYGIIPNNEATVVSQAAESIFGRSTIYYGIQAMTALILILAANTGFSAFPMLAVNLANDRFLPRVFSHRGDRLVFSNGIISLGVAAILIILLFQGKTEALIPLYAVGVFIPFTLAQTGMLLKWWRERGTGWQIKWLINSLGAFISLAITGILFATKFQYVWPVLLFLPIMTFIFLKIYAHYKDVEEQLYTEDKGRTAIQGHVFIMPVSAISSVVDNSLRYAQSLHPDLIIAVFVATDHEEAAEFAKNWKTKYPETRLSTLISPYRNLSTTLIRFFDKVEKIALTKQAATSIIVPEFIVKKKWHFMLHNQSSLLLKTLLLYRKDLTIITVPYHFKK